MFYKDSFVCIVVKPSHAPQNYSEKISILGFTYAKFPNQISQPSPLRII